MNVRQMLDHFRRSVDQVFESFYGYLPRLSPRVTIQNNQLTIEGERKAPAWTEKAAWPHTVYGKFYSAVTLPAGLDLGHISCRLQHGVLDIPMPMTATSKPKQIPVHAAGEPRSRSAHRSCLLHPFGPPDRGGPFSPGPLYCANRYKIKNEGGFLLAFVCLSEIVKEPSPIATSSVR